MVRNNSEAKKIITDAAIDIISKKGFSAATTNEIAKTAGYSEATIFKYFKTKKGLLDAIVLKLTENIAASVGLDGLQSIIKNGNLSFEKIIDMILEDRIQFIEKNFELIKILIVEVQFHEDVRNNVIEQILEPIMTDIDTLVKDQIEKGNIIEIDPVILIKTMFSGIFMSILPRILMNQPVDTNVLRQEFQIIKNIYLHGILKE